MLASCEIVVLGLLLKMLLGLRHCKWLPLMVLVNYYELLRFNEARIGLF